MKKTAVLFGLLLAAPAGGRATAQTPAEWNRPGEPFRVIGNVYDVGTAGIAVYLIATPKGHILIDGALPESAPLIMANIRKLGFRLRDIRYMLINHAHWDHAGGLAALKRLTGAKLLASAADRPALEAGQVAYRPNSDHFPPVKVDGPLRDGDAVRLGGTTLTTLLTPGHTKGCTSWTTDVTEGRRRLRVLFACSITVAGQRLKGDPGYPQAAADFRRTFARLKAQRADVFLSYHPEAFGLADKRARQLRGDPDAYVDPGELAHRVAAAEAAFDRELAVQ